MVLPAPSPPAASPQATPLAQRRSPGRAVVAYMTTTDHKKIGTLYLATSFVFFCATAASRGPWPPRRPSSPWEWSGSASR
ncbi:hypothetical protein ACWGJT_30320 [Streptomyces xantholiticus]|nr:hypothetical protein CGZ69_16855 [Streptomyces peucetius subsp. caesius ATCC 27952]